MSESPAGGRVRGRDWSDLQPVLLELITRKINEIEDFVRFGAVCKSWRSASISTNLKPQVPWAVLPYDPESSIRRFYSVSTNTVHTLHLPGGHVLVGTSHGWLVMADISSPLSPSLPLSISIFNPLSRTRIPLPPITAFLNNDIGRFLSTPDGLFYSLTPYFSDIRPVPLASLLSKIKAYMFIDRGEFIVVMSFATHPHRISYCRRGDAAWTTISSGLDSRQVALAYHGGRLYVLGASNHVRVCDLSLGADAVFVLIPSLYFPAPISAICMQIGVTSAGELLLICMPPGRQAGFSLYKSDLSADQPTWSKVRGIGADLTFFVSTRRGCGDLISFPDSDASRCKKSSIYHCGNSETLQSHGIQIHHVAEDEDAAVSEYIGREMMTSLEDAQYHPSLSSVYPTWMTPSLR